MSVNALVLTGYGLNCDHETGYALKLAGAAARRVHINALIDGTVIYEEFGKRKKRVSIQPVS